MDWVIQIIQYSCSSPRLIIFLLVFTFSFTIYFYLSFPLWCHSLQYMHAFVNELTILVPVLNESKHTFAIYTPERTKQRFPIRLAAATELEMHDWVCMDTSQHSQKKHCITIVYFVSSDIKTILFIYFCLLKSLVVGLSLPSWHNLSTFISVPVSSWRCWAFRAATPGGSRALPPNRPSGQSPVKGTSLLVSPPLLWRPCLTPHHVTRCKKTISLMSS